MQRGNVQCTTDIEEILVQTAAKHELFQIVTWMSEQWTPKLDKGVYFEAKDLHIA